MELDDGTVVSDVSFDTKRGPVAMTDFHPELLSRIRSISNNCHDRSAVKRLQNMVGEIEKRFCIPHVLLVAPNRF